MDNKYEINLYKKNLSKKIINTKLKYNKINSFLDIHKIFGEKI